MKLRRKSIRPKIDFAEIPKKRLIAGVFLGIFHAVIWYALLYLSREGIRICFSAFDSVGDFRIWVFTDAEVNFYNIFFACIAVIFGHSECIRFWLEVPRKFRDKFYRRRLNIIHEQKALNWIFMMTFAKVFSLVGLFISGLLWRYEVFDFNSEYRYAFFLVIIVLYLNTWNGIRHYFKNASLKWMLVSIGIVVSFSLLLSRINWIDYKEINTIALKDCIICQNDIKLASSDISQYFHGSTAHSKTFHLVRDSNNIAGNPICYFEYKKIRLEDLSDSVSLNMSIYDERMFFHFTARCIIDKRIKMKYIHQLYNELLESKIEKIAFDINPKGESYFRRKGIESVFVKKIVSFPYELLLKEKATDTLDYIDIYDKENYYYQINGTLHPKDSLTSYFINYLEDIPNNVFIYHIDDEMTFDHYMELITAYRSALNTMKNEYSEMNFNKPYDIYELSIEEKKELNKEYPNILYEANENMKKGTYYIPEWYKDDYE